MSLSHTEVKIVQDLGNSSLVLSGPRANPSLPNKLVLPVPIMLLGTDPFYFKNLNGSNVQNIVPRREGQCQHTLCCPCTVSDCRRPVQQTKWFPAFSLTAFQSCLVGLARRFIVFVMLTMPRC